LVKEAPYGPRPYTVDWSLGQAGLNINVIVASDQLVTALVSNIQGNMRMDEVLIENAPDRFTQEAFSVCQGESNVFPDGYTLENITYATSFYSELQTANRCDSAVMTMITLIQLYTITSTTSLSISCTNQADASRGSEVLMS
jgi:hypothetical protein